MSPLGAIYTPRGLLKLPVYPPFRLAVPSLAMQPSPYLSTGVPRPATVQAADALRLPATTVTRPVFWLILRIMVAPKLAWVAGQPLPILSAPVVVQTVAVPPPTVVMVYGSTSGAAACASSRGAPSPVKATRTTIAFNSLNPVFLEPRRIVRPRNSIPILLSS